ncbi:Tetratricopeptide repeat protein 28 [Rhizoctonia solani]|uniref:Tetratricopeptide repeat protein 28 n=1 Tax=Rhizoctonia solani TaxID=456999 RepID=A0A0K6G886_9AGAM|nr:Tetratricopeptide repeat protein 28 [Rhizoctonia solani]
MFSFFQGGNQDDPSSDEEFDQQGADEELVEEDVGGEEENDGDGEEGVTHHQWGHHQEDSGEEEPSDDEENVAYAQQEDVDEEEVSEREASEREASDEEEEGAAYSQPNLVQVSSDEEEEPVIHARNPAQWRRTQQDEDEEEVSEREASDVEEEDPADSPRQLVQVSSDEEEEPAAYAQHNPAQWRRTEQDEDEDEDAMSERAASDGGASEEENVPHSQWHHPQEYLVQSHRSQEDSAQWHHAQEDTDEERSEQGDTPSQSPLGQDRELPISFPHPSVGEHSAQSPPSPSDPPSPDAGYSFSAPGHVPWAPPSSGSPLPSTRSLNVHEQISQNYPSFTPSPAPGGFPPSSETRYNKSLPQVPAPPFHHQQGDTPPFYQHPPSFPPAPQPGHGYGQQAYPTATNIGHTYEQQGYPAPGHSYSQQSYPTATNPGNVYGQQAYPMATSAGHFYEQQGYPTATNAGHPYGQQVYPTGTRGAPGNAQPSYYNASTPASRAPPSAPSEQSGFPPNLAMSSAPPPLVSVMHSEDFSGGRNDAPGDQIITGYRPYGRAVDEVNMTFDTTASLLSDVLEAPTFSHPASEAPGVSSGIPFMGLETGLDMPSFSKIDTKTVSVQSQSIEYGLTDLRKKNLTTGREADASRIRPILQLGQTLNNEASNLEARMRNGDRLNAEFLKQAKKTLNEFRELLELIHLPSTRNDSSHRPLLDMSLSVLAMLARSLFSLPKSSNSQEYFRLSKLGLLIATAYLPESHPAKPIIASHWGTLYLERFQFYGNKSHITQAIKFHRQSVEAMPVDYPRRAMFVAWLGRSYLARFEDSQSAEDLKNGIEYSSQAWKGIRSKPGSATVEEKKYIFEGASRGLQCLIEHVGGSNSITLINTGIREWRSTLYDLLKYDRTAGDLKAGCMRILGFLYITRFNQLGSRYPRDLERGLTFLASAVALLPERHQDYLSTLCVFAYSLATRSGAKAGPDSELAFGFLELAERLTKSVPAFEPHLLACFGDLYKSLSRQGADLVNITKAIEYYTCALTHPVCRPGSRLWAKVRQRLGVCRLYEYNQTRKPAEAAVKLELALREFIHVTLSPRGHLFDRFTAACSWATHAASHPMFRAQSLYGYETTMELIPLLANFGAVPDQRRKATQRAGQLATEAAATAIKVGNNVLALALLEQGRSIKWNHMLQLQSPLHTLKLSPGGELLANRLEEILKSLQLGGSASSATSTKQSSHGDLDLQDRYQQVLDEIRRMKGFANFMRPKPIEDLVKAAHNGPAVVINIHKSRCDALVVHPFKGKAGASGVQHIPLPELSPDRVIKMRDAIDQSLEKISSARGSTKEKQQSQGTKQLEAELRNLWYWVVEPILKGLKYKPRSPRDPDPNKLPRVTWCATGPLSFLPLHAAGDYTDPSKRTYEYVVSSYTPTLTALVPDSHHDVLPKDTCDILMVNPETGSGKDALPAAEVELKCITRHFRTATGSLGRRLGDEAENLSWIWESAANSSNNPQAQTTTHFSLDLDGVSDDESNQGPKTKLPLNPGQLSHYTRLDGPKASPEKVYEEMQKHDWVHFACHAVQNNGDPAKCGFYLRGKLLSLQKIARMRYERRGLAFLSACRTAKGDQNLPDEAVHLASGMLMIGYLSVIATLWPVRDSDAPFVTNIVYKRLLVDEGMKCQKSAVALHTALDKLRKEPGVRLPDWISFVHYGA